MKFDSDDHRSQIQMRNQLTTYLGRHGVLYSVFDLSSVHRGFIEGSYKRK